ncbi:hypothetical protein FCG40_11320 [Fimbriimonadia bacterium ATM]|nr:MAG: hypothetical protein EDM73_12590 [Armatimonadota bacterium]MCE7900958.1 hypothetical protein [Armatimonadetes bacterium ATM1]MDL1929565.1 hypothetical protein [Fimbriimonadia bacterium ATM]RIJ94863.1 MAG: hypothetical protein DCC45_11935 [Armatimonadota bacterium]
MSRIKVAAGVLVVCVGLAGLWFWSRSRPRTIADDAVVLLEALLEGDAKTLWDGSVEKKRGDSGLTGEEFEFLYRELIRPRLERWKPYGSIVKPEYVNPDGSQGAMIGIRSANGLERALSISVRDDGTGRGRTRVVSLLNRVWVLEYEASGGNLRPNGYRLAAEYFGLKKDMPYLVGVGMAGKTPVGEREKVMPLKEWYETAKKEAEFFASRLLQTSQPRPARPPAGGESPKPSGERSEAERGW